MTAEITIPSNILANVSGTSCMDPIAFIELRREIYTACLTAEYIGFIAGAIMGAYVGIMIYKSYKEKDTDGVSEE